VEISDEVLCRRVAERDDDAFELLVERHQRRAHRVAWSILGDADEAKDLSQEAFLRLFEKAASFDGRSRFTTWFHRLLVNLCLDRRRQRRPWLGRIFRRDGDDEALDVLDAEPAPVEDPVEKIDRSEKMSLVWKAADRLSAQQRAALVLQVEEDLSTAEIADVLGCSEATVRVHLHRAMSALRKAVVR